MSKWNDFVKQYRMNNPGLRFGDLMKQASYAYCASPEYKKKKAEKQKKCDNNKKKNKK